jgi:uncharacterized membrane protein YjgN (DUF898 family)
MKNYFKFNLTGKKVLPYWLLMLLFILGLGLFYWSKTDEIKQNPISIISVIGAVIVFYLFMFSLMYYIYKLSIENIEYKDQTLVFEGNFGRFFGLFLPGFILSITTLGIYIPWFIKKMQSFFVNNSSYNSNNLKFKGKGGDLFIILLITFFIPYVFILVLFTLYTLANNMQDSPAANALLRIVTTFVMIPYMYFLYKWLVNIKYKNYLIVWKTDAWDACGKIFVQILLSVITLGIYYPMAFLKLYKYFTGKTVAISDEKTKTFGYDLEAGDDFLFIWGQILLTIVTLGIYYPWAACKIANRIMGKSYVEDMEIAKPAQVIIEQ